MRRTKTKAAAQVVGAAVLFSTGGAAIKTAAFSAMQVASIRSGVAAALLVVWFRGRVRWSWPAVAVGAVYALTLVLFVSATKLTTAAHAIFLQSTAPMYVAVLGPAVLGERFRARDIGILAAVAGGLALCLLGGGESTVTAPDPRTGNLLGALCGLTWGLTLLGLRWSARTHPDIAVSAIVAGNTFAFLVGIPALSPWPVATAGEWATLGYLGVFQIGVAYILLTAAIGELQAFQASLLLLLEPALNPLWAWLIRGEAPGLPALVGGGIIVVAGAAQGRSGRAGEPSAA